MAKKKTHKKSPLTPERVVKMIEPAIPYSKKRLAGMPPENRKTIMEARKNLRKKSDLNKASTSRKRRAASQTSGTKTGRRMPRKGY